MVLSKTNWQATSNDENLMVSFLFLGYALGSFSSTYLADQFGRKKILQYTSFFYAIIGYGSILITNLYIFIISRLIVGYTVGILIPVSLTLLTESIPQSIRGKFFQFSMAFFTIGELNSSIMFYLIFDELKTNQWKWLIAITPVFASIIFIAINKFLYETPIYLLYQEKFSEANDILNAMIAVNKAKELKEDQNSLQGIQTPELLINNEEEDQQLIDSQQVMQNQQNRSIYLTEEDKQILINWTLKKIHYQHLDEIQYHYSYSQFLIPQNAILLFKVLLLFFFEMILEFGIYYAQTEILFYKYNDSAKDDKNKLMGEMIISFIAEIPGYFLPILIMEKKFFGRKKSLQIGFFIIMLCCLIIIFGNLGERSFIIVNLVIRCFSGYLTLLFLYSLEIFPTTLRSKGVGLGSFIGKLSAMWIGWINTLFFKINFEGPLMFYGIIALMAIIVLIFLPETQGKGLDSIENEKENQGKNPEKTPNSIFVEDDAKKND